MPKDNTVKSLKRAIAVLDCFSQKEPELGVTEIARKLDMQKSTIFNILTTFQESGILIKNPSNNKYQLGYKLLHLSYIINSGISIREDFLPFMKEIANATGEVCYFGLLDGLEVLYIDAVYPMTQLQARNILGERAPLYCTGLGKAMLANLSEEQINEVLSGPMPPFTKCTITDPDVLRIELEEIRQNGFAVDNMEHEFGIRCVAVPVFGLSGKILGAVSVSGPSPRFDPPTIVRTAAIITEKLKTLQRCY
ncbi:MAG: IclR family transcriptional regulator [Clostridia bacterium]|nr:IclR family transcriptional regulator [Clostridia bacterium]